MLVLIVDDSKTVQRINKQIVESLGHKTIVASDGQEGLASLTAEVDVVLLDVNMPILDGFGFLERSVRDRKKFGTKVFMCTTEGGREEVVRALRLGANNYIVKPIKREVLVEKLQGLE